jgi:hypothetical protein
MYNVPAAWGQPMGWVWLDCVETSMLYAARTNQTTRPVRNTVGYTLASRTFYRRFSTAVYASLSLLSRYFSPLSPVPITSGNAFLHNYLLLLQKGLV